MSKDLIRDYNDKQQAQYSSNLEIPKVVAPKLQDATPVNDKQFQVTTPQGQPLEQMVAPTPDKELGMLSNEQLQNPAQDVTQNFNDRLSRQLPTLLFGEPTDAERRSNEFYDWVGNQIEDNRKRSAAQAMTMPSLSQYNTPTQTQPNGFGQSVLKGLFGSDKTNTADDGILGNEFDITKGRFGQYGNGVVGGLMYFLDNTLGLGALRNSLMDTAANLSSQAAGWTASGGVLDTLFKTGDVGKSIIAGSNRQKQALRNIYGGETPTSFLMQGALGRDLGALGNLSGDSHDDYRKMYGSSPVAAGLDRAFFGRSLTEQESKDYEKLTGYSVKQTLDAFAGGENKAFNLTPEEQKEYNEILGRVPEDFKTKMLLRNMTGLVADIKADDLLKPLATINRAQKASNVVVPKLPALEGSPNRLELPGASPTQRALPPRERMTGAADEYMYNWLRRGEDISPRPMEAPRLGGSTDPWFGAVARGNDPWVTIDATAVRVPDALKGVDNAALPYAKSSPLPPSTPLDSVIGNRTITAMPTQEFINSVNTSAAKALVVSPPIDAVRSPLQESVADVLRQQYMTRVEPGQYILQRLGTAADNDPIIALKSIEPAPRISNPVILSLPPAKLPTQIAGDLQKAFANTEGAKTTQFWYEDKLVQEQIRSGLLPPQSEIKETPRSVLPETSSTLPKDVAKEDITQPPSKQKEPETPSEVPPKELQEVKPKMIPSSKEELLRKARERLDAEKAQRSGVEQPTKQSGENPKTETNDVVVKNEAATKATPVEGETPKQRMLREAREKLDAEKAQRRLEAAVTEGVAKPVDNGVEIRVDLDNPKGQELLNDAIDFDSLFNKTYSFEDLDTMVSMVSRAAAGAPLSFVGKVAPIGEVSRSQKEIYRFASLVPDPMNPGKPLLAPTKSMVAEYAAKYGVEHPYASSAIADSSMKYLTKNGGARRHKSLADLAAEQSNPLYRKILSPTGTPIPLAVIERFEKQISQGGQALVKTSSDTVSAIDTAKPVVDTQSQQMVKRTRTEAQKFIDDNKLGIKKNLSADKINDALTIYESKGLDAVPDEYFTKAGLTARKSASVAKEVETVKKAEVREKKLETKAKNIIKTETLEDFEEAIVKLEDMEPTIEELERIQKKVSSLPIFDHRKKLSSPSHTDAVISEAKTNPKIAEKQQRYEELTTQLQEAVTQEQELVKTKQAIDVAIDDVDAQQQARVSKFMERYGMARSDAQEFDDVLQALLSRGGVDKPLITEAGWTRSRKAAMKGVAQSLLDVDDVRTSTTYEAWRQNVIDDGSYEKAAAWLYQNSGTKKSTNPVVSIDADGNFDFISGSSTFFAAMDSGVDKIPVQIVFDARLGSKQIEWTKHPLAKGERTKISVADLDRRWKTDRVEPGGIGGIGNRYADAREFMKANDKINMSEIVAKPDGSVVFKDGRHRFAVLRDEGVGVISVMAENPQYLNAANVVESPKVTTLSDVVDSMYNDFQTLLKDIEAGQPRDLIKQAADEALALYKRDPNPATFASFLGSVSSMANKKFSEAGGTSFKFYTYTTDLKGIPTKTQEAYAAALQLPKPIKYDIPTLERRLEDFRNLLDTVDESVPNFRKMQEDALAKIFGVRETFLTLGDDGISELMLVSAREWTNSIKNRGGVETLLGRVLRKYNVDGMYFSHGLGTTASDWNALREAVSDERIVGKKVLLSACQTGCSRSLSLIPSNYVLDYKNSSNATLFSVVDPSYKVTFNAADIKALKDTQKLSEELGSRYHGVPSSKLENDLRIGGSNAIEVVKQLDALPTETKLEQPLDEAGDLNAELGNSTLPKGERLIREPLSRQNIGDALRMANSQGGAVDEVLTQVPSSQQLNVRKRRDPNAALPTTVGQAVKEFKDALAQVNRTGVMDDRTQIKLNNAVFAMESLDDKSYAKKMREVVARLTGRTADEGKPFMSAAVELLNDPTRSWSREQVADILSYAIGTKDVKFAQNLDDAEVLKFGRLVAQRPEVYSQFDHVYVGHGTGIVEHGTWSLEARPSTGYGKRELIQHVIDNEYPRGTEVGVSACETGCPKRIQDAVPPMHRVVSRGAVGSTLDNLQRLVEELSALPVPTKIMDVFAQYDGLLREAMSANKQRSLEILQEMSDIEDDFNVVNKKYKFKSEQQVRAKMKQAQDAIEKDLLGDC